jgi:hypothetical protein
MKRLRRWRTLGLTGVAALMAGGTMSACADNKCVPLEQYFAEQVWAPIMSTNCLDCHNSTGAAKDSQFILQTEDWPGYLEYNLETVSRLAQLEYQGVPWLLVKPTNGHGFEEVDHGGGVKLEEGSDEYKAIESLIEQIKNPPECEGDGPAVGDYFDGVEMLDEVETLRKASLALVGRLPTAAEEQKASLDSWDGVDEVLDSMMEEDEFYVFIKEMFNDKVLTERYNTRTEALDLLDPDDYPDTYWFDAVYANDDTQRNIAESFSNRAVAQEALELIAHVIREDRPFTEVISADYTMVNPYSAQVYGLNVNFDDPDDENEFREAKLPGIPHSGILTSSMFLNRFPTTDTNRNRHRSRMFYNFFLATDVLKLAERPIDPSAVDSGVNPTLNDPNCNVCHEVIDPVAGAFQNWDDQGRYRPPEGGWHGDMKVAGFGDEEMSSSQYPNALQWLSEKVVEDQRFATSIVRTVYTGMTGAMPLSEPNDPNAADYLGRATAFRVENELFLAMADAFVGSDYDIKLLFKEVAKSQLYRAENIASGVELDEEREFELADLGTARLLTPEGLNRKIWAVTGYPWRDDPEDRDYLLDQNWYRIFYGGIDSDSITARITEPNGLMANIGKRMANEMACATTARDFAKSPATRVLFPFVDRTFEPEDSNGFEIPAVREAIRANLQYLHERLLGEYVELDGPEINRTYALFLEVWRDGKNNVAEGTYDANLNFRCRATQDWWTGQDFAPESQITNDQNYTVRAWMAVMSYLLSDYRFLYE